MESNNQSKRSLTSLALLSLVSTMPLHALAQPADATSAHPVLRGVSAFDQYHAFDEPPVGNWQERNQVVDQRGGWRAYQKEAFDNSAPASAPGAEGQTSPKAAKQPATTHQHGGHP